MALSSLPLSYCTNVHAGRSVNEIESGLDAYTVPVAREFGAPLAAGLWLAKPVVDELLGAPEALPRFADGLRRRGLTCHTLNAFPYGDFHGARVKENVYVPDWADPRRLAYTLQCATVLAQLLPDGVDGSISTVPLGFKQFEHPAGFVDACVARLLEMTRFLARLREETGKLVRLAIEPEPLCVLETTAETIEFFERFGEAARRESLSGAAAEHVGVCYDVCHQAVEFEDAGEAIGALAAAGVRINKVHVSCAIEVRDPAGDAEARAALRRYVEPRYLHQVMGRDAGGRVTRAVDLSEALIDEPPAGLAGAEAWRVHFHVPVDAERLGPLGTTRAALVDALGAVAGLSYAPHLEVETYTWEVLPGRVAGGADLVAGLARELTATRGLIESVRG